MLLSAVFATTWAADLTGTWRLDLHLVHDVKVPVLGRSRSDSYTTQLWTVDGLELTNAHCDIRIETRMPIGKPSIPDAFVEHIPPKQAELVVGEDTLFVDMGIATIGYTGGALPTDPEDPRVVDHEGDGHPGATISVWAPLFGHVPIYVAQRNHLLLTGDIEGDTIRGEARQTELGQQTLAAGNRLFRKQPTLTPVYEESTFTLTRVSEDATCAQLLTHGASGG